jgi:predicted O-methyltransferase YrrM
MIYQDPGLNGWMCPKSLQWLYTQAKKHHIIVEIGSWAGRSTHALCSGCPGMVYAVDSWVTPIFGLDPQEAYMEFLGNMRPFLNLQILKMDSLKAASAFPSASIDMVFIDGCHEYLAVKADILTWKPKIRPDGLLAGHDYNPKSYPGVVQAVKELHPQAKVVPGTTIWWVTV